MRNEEEKRDHGCKLHLTIGGKNIDNEKRARTETAEEGGSGIIIMITTVVISPEQRARSEVLENLLGHRHVGCKHELLDHVIGLAHLVHAWRERGEGEGREEAVRSCEERREQWSMDAPIRRSA